MDFKLKKSNLNFKVYSASKLPSTGNENDIVIISNTPMTNWILSPDKPNGAPRTDGDVWIKYSVTGNTVNVLKTGAMMVATTSAWQYVDGAWVSKTAKSYQGGEWVDWVDWVIWIDLGVDNWTVLSNQNYSSSFTNDNNGNIVVSSSQGQSNTVQSVGRYCKKPYDLTHYKQLIFKGTFSHSGNANNKVYLGATKNLNVTMNQGAAYTEINGNFERTVDVSELTGEFYIGFTMRVSAGTTNNLTITEITLR